jgi:hypothetical protein
MPVTQMKNSSIENNGVLWIPSQAQMMKIFGAALQPFGDISILSVDSFNIKASNLFLGRSFESPSTGARFQVRSAQDFAGLLSACTRVQGQALLSPLEALDHLVARFLRQSRQEAENQGSFFPSDWTLGSSDLNQEMGVEPARVCRMLASLSLVEIRLWK